MIKINLLPKTINQKAILRNTAIAFGALLVAIIAGGVTYSQSIKNETTLWTGQADAAEALKARVESVQGQAQTMVASIKPMLDRLTFIADVEKYNQVYPKLYAEVAKWTYKNVQYTSLSSNGTQVTMNARAKNVTDLGRYLLNMYHATDLFTGVSIDVSGETQAGGAAGGAPAYAPAGPAGASGSLAGIGAISSGVQRAPGGVGYIDFTVTCTLKTPIAKPTGAGLTGIVQPAQ